MMNYNVLTLPPKKDFYKKQQQDILTTIERCLCLNEINRSFIYYDINDYTKNYILQLRSDIVAYFFTNGKDLCNYTWMDLVEFVFRNMNYDCQEKNISIIRDNKSVNTIVFTFVKKQNP